MSTTDNPRTRRYVLGCAAAALSATSIPATAQDEQTTESLQQTEPDGKIITLDTCTTATVEGDMWDLILVGILYYENGEAVGNETKGFHPAADGITRINFSGTDGAVIEDVACYVERDDGELVQVANASRENLNACIGEPTTTTQEPDTTTDETTTPEPFDPRFEFDGCSSVTISNDRYTVVELTFTDRSTETFRGEWTSSNTFTGFGENAGKDIMEVRVSDGEANAWKGNPNGCAKDEVTPDTTEVIVTPHNEPTTTTTASGPHTSPNPTTTAEQETTTSGDRLIDWLFGLFA